MNLAHIFPTTTLIRAASDGRHRPASHPVLSGNAVAVPDCSDPLIGRRIRAKRIVKGWTQYDLAREMGVSRPAVAQWEADSYRPSAAHAARLEEMLG